MSKVAIVQMTSNDNYAENLNKSLSFVEEASRLKTELIAFPENFLLIANQNIYKSNAVPEVDQVTKIFQQKAVECDISILMGSILEKIPLQSGKYYNTSLLIDQTGCICARYRKIHLFDITHPEVVYKESEHIVAGDRTSVYCHAIGTVGLSICYDIRFPVQYQTLTDAGAEIIFVPAAFTVPTGKAHWLTLLQARAIENQVFIIAPAQFGKHSQTKESFGNSVLIDPWGEILARAADGEGIITGEIDLKKLQETRSRMPVLNHKVTGIDRF
ncbi:MAG: carbon-nitrogen hydrolase family protein [SAR324 cluster bacterium]|nr:carbon-nitrogen hydrolase family protein [SAR324 cluster bacterium]